ASVAALLAATLATPAVRAADIYSCVDSHGRRITADRPILDCIDREQTELTPSGVKKRIGPSLTADERAAQEEQARREAEERNRQLDQRRRDRALLLRYPDRATHDRERQAALAAVDAVIATASKRDAELVQQRKKLDAEMEFYARDPKKTPARLKRQIDENEQQQQAQTRYIATQQEERQRINERYDRELQRLAELWTGKGPSAQTAAPAAAAPAKAPGSNAR
ncbi:DUF4124 domain-containing protein, partial [Ramlibacter aquaticus]|uniref:DUF4124 domain-containing protein n=1 Tax=Ramlibacter aquaticus TaxID=2780094 RepID=UPI002AB167F0